MKAMILAGGFGSRLAEETDVRPKPMVEIGGRPIIWHIMQHYSKHGIREFVICLGYKAESIKKFFIDYAEILSDFTVDLSDGSVEIHKRKTEDWKVTLVDTGYNTMTGGRVKRAMQYIEPEETFCLTYGDGLANVDITASIKFHESHGKLATVTAITPPGRFGVLDIIDDNCVQGFREKVTTDTYKINGGFFVLNKAVVDFIDGDDCIWEQAPMQRLAVSDELRSWNHNGFWQPMDTLREKILLEELWKSGTPPWKE
jgi:glucose-1-phosphate cytidylyltransferase